MNRLKTDGRTSGWKERLIGEWRRRNLKIIDQSSSEAMTIGQEDSHPKRRGECFLLVL